MTEFSLHYPEDMKQEYILEYGPLPTSDIGGIPEAVSFCKQNGIPLYLVTVHQVDNEGTDEEEHGSMNLEEAYFDEVEDIVEYLS